VVNFSTIEVVNFSVDEHTYCANGTLNVSACSSPPFRTGELPRSDYVGDLDYLQGPSL